MVRLELAHAANAFTCASFFAHRWDLGYAEPVVWALATGVSLGRMADDAHWASDTLVGMGFGWVIGRMIAQRYEERDAEREAEREAGAGTSVTAAAGAVAAAAAGNRLRLEGLEFAPIAGQQGAGVIVSASVRF